MFTGYKAVNTLERGNKDFHNKSYFYVDNFVHSYMLHQSNAYSSFLSRNIPNPRPGYKSNYSCPDSSSGYELFIWAGFREISVKYLFFGDPKGFLNP